MTTPVSDDVATVASLGERALIARIRAALPHASTSLVVGIGDDAAVATPARGALLALTTDALVEGVHFDRRLSSAADIGARAIAVNASDIAAMGASPELALLSLVLPPALPLSDLDALIDGVAAAARAAGVVVAGGNITRSPGALVVDITMTGSVRPRRVLTRAGARAGDLLYVSGAIGAAAAGLAWLLRHANSPLDSPDDPGLAECVTRHRRPEPRTRLGGLLGRNRAATACMDLSDGLADAVRQVAEASGLGAEVTRSLLPIHSAAAAWFAAAGQDAVEASLAGGDDYELLFAVASKSRRRLRTVERQARGVALTAIGRLTADPAIVLIHDDGRRTPLPDGFAHF